LYGRYVEEDAHSAEERAAALDKNAGEHEGQHRALEHMVQKLQKKLDVCVNDRGVLSGELGSATRKAAGAGHLELLNRQCEGDREDAVALQMELKREMAGLALFHVTNLPHPGVDNASRAYGVKT
jgi:hypothetical protein